MGSQITNYPGGNARNCKAGRMRMVIWERSQAAAWLVNTASWQGMYTQTQVLSWEQVSH